MNLNSRELIRMAQKTPRSFEFTRDTFAFANELLWEYRTDAVTGRMHFRKREPKPDYAHRCFVLTRAARQFLYHAAFDPASKTVDDGAYRRLVCDVLSRDPRKPSTNPVVIPGFAHLREFSVAREQLLKSICGGAWRSYVLRSHWRMLFPISRTHQQQSAEQLFAGIKEHFSPIIHLVKFPSLTINHGMILFDAERTGSGIRFSAYDPNLPERAAELTFDGATRTFYLPANTYWAGGDLNVIEIFRNWFL
jgi:hypothetical protein